MREAKVILIIVLVALILIFLQREHVIDKWVTTEGNYEIASVKLWIQHWGDNSIDYCG